MPHNEAGDDLIRWTVVGSSVTDAAFTGEEVVSETDADGGLKRCLIRDTQALDPDPPDKRFMRVRAQGP